jgi:4a-hydroxytetrahydrobiopterin dehydratase
VGRRLVCRREGLYSGCGPRWGHGGPAFGRGDRGDEIVRTFEFDSYLDGVGFASGIGGIAEDAWHHPEITITWGEVEVRLTTHDAGGITQNDTDLAARFNDVYE